MSWAASTWAGTFTVDQRIHTPPGGYDAATLAWETAVGSINVSSGRKDLIDALIKGLKTDGVWTKLDRLWLFAAENSTCALTDLKALAVATAFNSPAFSADDGFTGNGTTSYINTNFNPVTQGVNFVTTTGLCCGGVWDTTTIGAGSSNVVIGTLEFGIYSVDLTLKFTDNNIYARVTSTGGAAAITYPGPGLYVMNRSAGSGANCNQLYRNGSSISTGSGSASASTASRDFYVCCRNNAGAASAFSSDQIAACLLGGTLDATAQGNLYTRLRTYMTAVGVP